jgi:hypothetical protein
MSEDCQKACRELLTAGSTSDSETRSAIREDKPRGSMHEIESDALIAQFPSEFSPADRSHRDAKSLGENLLLRREMCRHQIERNPDLDDLADVLLDRGIRLDDSRDILMARLR